MKPPRPYRLRVRLRTAWDALRGDPYDAMRGRNRSEMTRALNRAGFVVLPEQAVHPDQAAWLRRDSQIRDSQAS